MRIALRLPIIALTLLGACGGAPTSPTSTTPASTAAARSVVSAGVALQSFPPSEPGGAASIQARAMLVDAAGTPVATLDLGQTGVDASSCAATEAPSIAEQALSITFECLGSGQGYRISLVDRRDHVDVWTFLADDGAGNWQMAGTLYVPGDASVRLLDAPITTP